MKRTILALLFIFFSTSSFGQKIWFSDPTNKWAMSAISAVHGALHFSPNNLYYSNDSVFSGNTYHHIGHAGFVWEDTIAKKVYFKNINDITVDTTTRMLYDYNWVVGDTVKNGKVYWVYLIDSTQINSMWYKVWHFMGYDPLNPAKIFHYNVIEGIGCTNGFSYPLQPTEEDEYATQLTCFENNGVSYPLSIPVLAWGVWELNQVNFDNTTSCTVGINLVQLNFKDAIIIPNPIDNTSKILFPRQLASGIVSIINSIGQVVSIISFENKEELTIGDKIKVPGIYYYRVTDNISGETFSGKFVNQ